MVAVKTLISSVLFAGAVVAQQDPTGPITTNFSSSDIQSLVNAQTPTADTKLAWCNSQRALCGNLCSGNAQNNTCDQTTLMWSCTCASNNSQPALQYYPISMIGNECNALKGNCLAKNANDLSAQTACKSTYICGNATTDDASKAAAAGASSSSSASGTSGQPSATASSAAGAATSSTQKGAAIAVGQYAPPMFSVAMLGALAAFL